MEISLKIFRRNKGETFRSRLLNFLSLSHTSIETHSLKTSGQTWIYASVLIKDTDGRLLFLIVRASRAQGERTWDGSNTGPSCCKTTVPTNEPRGHQGKNLKFSFKVQSRPILKKLNVKSGGMMWRRVKV